MHKHEDISNHHIPAVGHTHKESFEPKKIKNPSMQVLPRPKIGTWRSRAATSPWGVTFGPEIENPCENHIL